MRSLGANVLLFLSALASAGTVNAADTARVQLRDIQSQGHKYVGQRIVTRGCIEDASPHGVFVRPCGTVGWKQILILEGLWEALPNAIVAPGSKLGQSVEADLAGVLSEEPNERAPGTHFVLHVDRTSHVVVHKP